MSAGARPRWRIGCTGWGYDDWKGGFYPPHAQPGEYLERYARVFDSTEIDSAYYKAPTRALAERWAKVTPAGFQFTSKLPGAITHEAKLRGTDRALDAFLDGLEPLARAGKLAGVVAQFPASFRREEDRDALHAFLKAFPSGTRLAVELRHPSWWVEDTYEALRSANATLAWSFTEAGRTPAVVTSDRLYLRLIGDRALTRFDRVQRDHTDEMVYWKRQMELAIDRVSQGQVMLNNHLMGFAPVTAVRMHEILGLPPPDLRAAARDRGQASLFG